jgi:periplasmic divalent cation tolerance protein
MEFIAVLTTFDDRSLAENLAKELLEKRLAACIQIAEIESFYRWKGNVENSKEFLCIIKTKKDLYEAVESEIKRLHSYEVPEIIALPILSGSKEYLSWIEEETKQRE